MVAVPTLEQDQISPVAAIPLMRIRSTKVTQTIAALPDTFAVEHNRGAVMEAALISPTATETADSARMYAPLNQDFSLPVAPAAMVLEFVLQLVAIMAGRILLLPLMEC